MKKSNTTPYTVLVSDPFYMLYNGTAGNAIWTLPDTTTLEIGMRWRFITKSKGNQLKTAGGTNLLNLGPNSAATLVVEDNTVDGVASWNING